VTCVVEWLCEYVSFDDCWKSLFTKESLKFFKMFGYINFNSMFVEATENAIRLLIKYLAYLCR